jgi:steroid 5-alpha reductase family enzyme
MQAEYLLPKLLVASLVLGLIYTLSCYVLARRRKRPDMFVLAWSGGFVLTAWIVAEAQPTVRTYMVAAMVTAWAVRQVYYWTKQRDRPDVKQARLASYIRRAITVWLIGLPIITNAGNALPSLRLLFTLGYITWAVGFYVQYKADSSKHEGAQDRRDKAELLQWWGIGLIAAQTSFGWLGLVGPLLLTYLIRNSANIPPAKEVVVKGKKPKR